MTPSADATRYLVWTGIVAIGAVVAVIDRRLIGWPVCGALLVAGIVGGLIITQMSPFSFGGGDHYMEGVIISAGSALAVVGYGVATVWQCARRLLRGQSRR
jgi:hypothetical protein